MFIKTTFNSDLNHILNCVNKCDFGTKCFAKVEHFVLRLIDIALRTGKCTGTISFENTSYRTNLDGWRLVSFR